MSKIPITRCAWFDKDKVNFIKAIDRKGKDQHVNKAEIERAITEHKQACSLVIYTDGSAEESNKNGGSCVHIINIVNYTTRQISKPAGKFTSFYQAEGIAMNETLKCVDDHGGEGGKFLVITDSLSICERIKQLCAGQRPDWDIEEQMLTSIMNISSKNNNNTLLWGRVITTLTAMIKRI